MPTMQVTMQCAEQLGCEDSIVKFVLPLGVTVNMNGTALYEATTVIFIAQVSFCPRLHAVSPLTVLVLHERNRFGS